jgi:protein-histidine pros-kinase
VKWVSGESSRWHAETTVAATPLRVLVVEDDPADAKLCIARLGAEGWAPTWTRVGDAAALHAALTSGQSWDVVLVDYVLPGFSAHEALRILRELGLDVPAIVVSGTVGEETAIECLKAGADDYVMKDRLERLGPVVARALSHVAVRRRAAEAERALAHSEAHFRTVFEQAAVGLALATPDGVLLEANRHLAAITGGAAADLAGRSVDVLLHPDDVIAWRVALRRLRDGDQATEETEVRIVRRGSATPVWVCLTLSRIAAAGDADRGRLLLVVSDVSERRRAEERLRQIVETVPNAIVVTDRAGRVVLVNSATEHLFGWPRETLIGRDVEVLVPEDHRGGHVGMREGFARAPATRSMAHGRRLEGRRRDGSQVPVEIWISPVPTEHGDLLMAAILDLTERRAVEHALQREADREAALARAGRELLSSLDTERTAARLCQLARELLDARECRVWRLDARGGLVLGHAMADCDAEPRRNGVILEAARVAPVLARLEEREVILLDRDRADDAPLVAALGHPDATDVVVAGLRRGPTPWGLLALAWGPPHEAALGRRTGLARDIAHLADLALANAGALEEQARTAQLKSDFVATLSHELRTPLSPIMGYVEMLLEGALGPVEAHQRDALVRVDRTARQLHRLIVDTLDLGRLEAGTMPVDVDEVQLGVVLALLAEEAADTEERPEVVFSWEVDDDVPPLRTDPVKLAVVLRNLVSNALKFTERGAVAVRARRVPEGVEIAVHDTGCGIPAESLEAIFESFRQLDGSMTRRHRGVGLGLYIARKLVKRLGGRIVVEQPSGAGLDVPGAAATRRAARNRGALTGRPLGPGPRACYPARHDAARSPHRRHRRDRLSRTVPRRHAAGAGGARRRRGAEPRPRPGAAGARRRAAAGRPRRPRGAGGGVRGRRRGGLQRGAAAHRQRLGRARALQRRRHAERARRRRRRGRDAARAGVVGGRLRHVRARARRRVPAAPRRVDRAAAVERVRALEGAGGAARLGRRRRARPGAHDRPAVHDLRRLRRRLHGDLPAAHAAAGHGDARRARAVVRVRGRRRGGGGGGAGAGRVGRPRLQPRGPRRHGVGVRARVAVGRLARRALAPAPAGSVDDAIRQQPRPHGARVRAAQPRRRAPRRPPARIRGAPPATAA